MLRASNDWVCSIFPSTVWLKQNYQSKYSQNNINKKTLGKLTAVSPV
jgi:hypothetical protein